MKVIVEIEVDVPDRGTAGQWAAAMLSLSRKCSACNGVPKLRGCERCGGRGTEPGEHPYRPRLLGTRVSP